MMSFRWPQPKGMRPSMAQRPVVRGSYTPLASRAAAPSPVCAPPSRHSLQAVDSGPGSAVVAFSSLAA
eukprot:10437550-Lingulodinium_polyedra.AAC.1